MSSDISKYRAGRAQRLNARPDTRACRQLLLFVAVLFLVSGCGTTKTYVPNTAAGPARPADYPIPMYTGSQRIPRPCELIGHLSIGDTQMTVTGGSLKGVMKTLTDTAHEKGADVVQIVSIKRPDFETAHYHVEANLLRYSDHWEKLAISEKEFAAYLQQHARTLDPIEGIWTDGSSEVIGIMKNTSKPGRDFVAFVLHPALPSWQKGYKKMDIVRESRPGGYSLKYYLDDFSLARTSVILDRNQEFNFLVHSADLTYQVVYLKVGAPQPLK